MIFIDYRECDPKHHQYDLPSHFKPYGDVDVGVTTLEYGDICFTGNGPAADGCTWVGIERKRISNLAADIRSGHLSGYQLSGMIDVYEFPYLLIEGLYRAGPHGELETRQGRDWAPLYTGRQTMLYREMDNFLTTMEMAGMYLRRTGTIEETAAVIVDLYKWFNDKTWDEHKAHKDIYTPVPLNGGGRVVRFVRETPTLPVKFASQLPGIDQKAWEIGKRFKTGREFAKFMATASHEEWNQVLGIKEGRKKAIKIQEALDQ